MSCNNKSMTFFDNETKSFANNFTEFLSKPSVGSSSKQNVGVFEQYAGIKP